MLGPLPSAALSELERALNAKLQPRVEAAELRRGEFALLSQLLGDWDGIGRPPLQRALYEELRGPGDPDSRSFLTRHGSWANACQAAVAEKSTVAAGGARQPWRTARFDARRPPSYSCEEIIRAYLDCWRAIGREPTSNVYYSWVAEQRRRARASGAPLPRLPTQRSVERHFEKWAKLRQAVALPQAESASHLHHTNPAQ